MSSEIKRSFIVTGGSATGKSWLYRSAIETGYMPLPTHMTRAARQDEVDGIDAKFISKDEFVQRFNAGEYLEPSLDWALLGVNRNYYGTPRTFAEFLSKDGYCAMLSNILAANLLIDIMLPNVQIPIWVHLMCPDDVRRSRLEKRGLSTIEIDKRLIGGDSLVTPVRSNLIFNTSETGNTPVSMLEKINN